MTLQEAHLEYILQIGDNALILGQRLGEWCGHGPVLEQDIAITNIALDLIGQARSLMQYAAELEGKGRDEDQMAFLRDAWDFRNVLLVEQPNEDWAYTITRQFLFDAFNFYFHQELTKSKDEHLAAIAEKSLKEITYHLRYSSEWMIRLGDGTELSHAKMQNAVNDLWMFTGELTEMNEVDKIMIAEGIGVDLNIIKPLYDQKIAEILEEATLQKPADTWMQSGGKQGRHTEHLGYILADMQFMQRAYPNMKW
ncbi:MAG: 1,2-phenylacetyl-CoA epoxidase subunit PaaC [Saprospiraceae bacterium]|nr:1,2-phenylacetyl-CoA epoxidase subunit PaaC [Saprospiraceae bacterium]